MSESVTAAVSPSVTLVLEICRIQSTVRSSVNTLRESVTVWWLIQRASCCMSLHFAASAADAGRIPLGRILDIVRNVTLDQWHFPLISTLEQIGTYHSRRNIDIRRRETKFVAGRHLGFVRTIDVINVYNVYKKFLVNAFIILSTFISDSQ